MAANKRSSDYIPYECELIAEHECRKEYMATHKDPRHVYECSFTYTMPGIGSVCKHTEKHMAYNSAEAEQVCRDEWSKVGINIYDLKVNMIEE